MYCAFFQPLEHSRAYSAAHERFRPSQFFVRTLLALAANTIGAACAGTGIRRSISIKWPTRHIPKRQSITKPQQNRIGKPRNNTARTTMRRARNIHRKPSSIPRLRASIPRRPTARVPKPSSSRFSSIGRPQRRLFLSAVTPGRPRRQVYAACVNLRACGEPGIHNHRLGLWIPNSRANGPAPRNDSGEIGGALTGARPRCRLIRYLPCQPVDQFLDFLEAVEARGAGRRENDVFEREQLVVAASRLLVEWVEREAAETA